MATIYENMHGLSPRIETTKRKLILDKYAHNKGVNEKSSTKYFSMLWEAFAWAAIMGFYHDKRKPINEEPERPFKYSQIYNQGSDIFYSLVLFSIAKEGYNIVKDVSEINKVIEEYANGGFEIIFTILREKGNDYFGDEANFLQELMEREKRVVQDYEDKPTEKKIKKVKTGDEFDLNF